MRGHDDHREERAFLANAPQNLDPVCTGHLDVEEGQVRRLPRQYFQCRAAIPCRQHVEMFRLEPEAQYAQNVWIIVYDKHERLHGIPSGRPCD